MKFLIDTNIFIPLEPTSSADIEVLSPSAARLLRLIQENEHQVFLHPKSLVDIGRDKNPERQQLRRLAFEKYPHLEGTAAPFIDFTMVVGEAESDSNCDVDNHLLFSVDCNAVDFFITEDRGIHKKARKLEIENKVLRIIDAIRMLAQLTTTHIDVVFPAIEKVKAYAIDLNDPIFDSLREGYSGFDEWFIKCRTDHRDCFVISGEEGLDALCVLKDESSGEYEMSGKVLKVCTFKVGTHASGYRYGELMLKAVLSHAYNNGYDWIYLTAFEENERICVFLDTFGFSDEEGFRTQLGENVFKRKLHPTDNNFKLPPLDFHIRFGPKYLSEECISYIVPIQPQYHRLLFPELERQMDMFVENNPFGNSILKAYICHSNMKNIEPGSLLFFYRSQDSKVVQSIGVAEKCIRSDNPTEIVQFVGKRTVYSYQAIVEMCHKKVLAILFRQANGYETPLSRQQLESSGVFTRPPQSISRISKEGHTWLLSQRRI